MIFFPLCEGCANAKCGKNAVSSFDFMYYLLIYRWDTAYTAYRSCLVKALCVETASDPEDTVNAFFDLCTQSETPPNKLFVAASANEQLDRFDMNDSVPSVYRVAVLVVRVAIKLTAVSSLLK